MGLPIWNIISAAVHNWKSLGGRKRATRSRGSWGILRVGWLIWVSNRQPLFSFQEPPGRILRSPKSQCCNESILGIVLQFIFFPPDSKLVSHLKSFLGFACSFHPGSMCQSKAGTYQRGFGCSFRVWVICVRARASISTLEMHYYAPDLLNQCIHG